MSYLKQPPSNNQFVEIHKVSCKTCKKELVPKMLYLGSFRKEVERNIVSFKIAIFEYVKIEKKTLSYGLKMTYYGTFTQEIVKVTLKRLRVPQNAKFHIKRKKS